MPSKLSLTPPSGFVEYSTQDQKNFNDLKNKIEQTYQSHGFVATKTPLVEHLDNLLAKGACDQEVFTLGRLGQEIDSQMGLRFDLTVPFARYVAAHQTHIAFPFKRYQIDPVFRGERPQAGRYRQFYQADIDIIAPEKLSEDFDAYILSVLHEALQNIEIDDVTYLVNHKKLLELLAQTLCKSQDEHAAFFRLLDKKEKISAQAFEEELRVLAELNKVDDFCQFLEKVQSQDFDQTLEHFSQYMQSQGTVLCHDLIKLLKNFKDYTEILGIPNSALQLSLTTARGLNYYTGIVFETKWHRFEQLGSIASGGRYENLVGQFSKRPYPGIGLSIGLSRIFSAYKDLLHENKQQEKSGILLVVPKEEKKNLRKFYRLFKLLRQSLKERGLEENVDIYLQNKKVQDQKKYALAKNYRWVCECHSDLLQEFSTSNSENLHSLDQKLLSEHSYYKLKDYTQDTILDCNYQQMVEQLCES